MAKRRKIEIAGDNHLETLGRCGGYYACPKDPNGCRLGPLVGYAGDYEAPDGSRKRFVGDVYANFALAESHPHVLKFFARCISVSLNSQVDLRTIDVFCGAPIGGYSLADALGLGNNIGMIKAEKKVLALKTPNSRETSKIVFARHEVKAGQRVVIAEDVCNNFSTTRELITLITSAGGIVLAIVCFLNRSMTVGSTYVLPLESGVLQIPVVSLVGMPINEWKQEDPAVAEDIAKGNVVWKAKDEWDRLMLAMSAHA
ncbi:MAG: hypothetical protein WC845_01295 [Candidatus Staskawiczbacteria bacterium]|jgi:orotate phosphoribosyltransferase